GAGRGADRAGGGGHVGRPPAGDKDRTFNIAPRTRHCPKCQALSRARWLAKEVQSLLPAEYHHMVFTLPREVADLALANPGTLYRALFQAAAATLRDVGADRQWRRASVGGPPGLPNW